MRRLIYDLLSSDATLMALLPGGLYGDRSLVETPSVKPFGVLMHEGPSNGMSARVNRSTVVLWVHDEVGDYTRIEAALRRARALLLAAVQVEKNGVWLMEADWSGDSVDLYDDARGTNVKNATFPLVGSGL